MLIFISPESLCILNQLSAPGIAMLAEYYCVALPSLLRSCLVIELKNIGSWICN
jgi:hypothetical protein